MFYVSKLKHILYYDKFHQIRSNYKCCFKIYSFKMVRKDVFNFHSQPKPFILAHWLCLNIFCVNYLT